jgi:hypothetical protein
MTTKEIKKWLRGLNLAKTLRVTSTGTKHPYFTAWFPYERVEGNKMIYPANGFPLLLRQIALRVIYGDDCAYAEQGGAGNINQYSMAMHAHEWQQTNYRYECAAKQQERFAENLRKPATLVTASNVERVFPYHDDTNEGAL